MPTDQQASLASECPDPSGSYPEGAAVLASFAIGTVALLMVNIQPFLLGALVEAGRLDSAQLGRVSGVEVAGLALASALAPRMMALSGLRLRTGAALAGLATVNFAMPWMAGFGSIVAARGLAGVLEGLALAACNAVMIHTRQPDRVNAAFFAAVGTPAILLAYLLPTMILPSGGADFGFALIGGAAVGALAALWWMPPQVAFAARPVACAGYGWLLRPAIPWQRPKGFANGPAALKRVSNGDCTRSRMRRVSATSGTSGWQAQSN
jgi:hypothetical protein